MKLKQVSLNYFLALTVWAPDISLASIPEQVLKSAWQDQRAFLHQETVSIATDAKSYNPFDKAEFRLEHSELIRDNNNDNSSFFEEVKTNGVYLYPIKAGIRFYPKGFTEHQTTVKFQQALELNEKTLKQQTLSKLLTHRYNLLARVALLKEKRLIAVELEQVTKKTSKMLSYSAQKDRTELRAYLKNKADIGKIELKISEIERDYKNLQNELKDLSLDAIENFDLSDFASMDDLKLQLDKAAEEKVSVTLSARIADLELSKSRAAMAYERAKDEKIFNHIEFSLKDNRRESIYGVELAFNLPFASAPNLSRIDKEIRDLHDKAELIETLETTDRHFKNGLTELKTLLAVHKTLRESQARMNPEQLRKASRAIAPSDPLLAIELQRGWYESREQLLDLEFQIRTLFILYLHESSTLANAPEINYLSKSLKRIL
ncbi:MAG: hypothetical protein H7061_05000 [Bdellovibrionaceae bacterium]|nr:hypothetical protein [Bdellovibrio sp.]